MAQPGVRMQDQNVIGQTEIAVIGAGAVGLSCAYLLARNGHDVTLIAPADDENGASYGNAGIIADYAVLPVATPDVLRNLPALLFDRKSPLALRPEVSLVPWLLRFARETTPARAAANAKAIAALLAPAAACWQDLAQHIGARDLLRQFGTLYLFETEADRRATRLQSYRAHGVRVESLSRDELGQLQPGLPAQVGVGGAFFPDALTVHDPTQMLRHLRAAVTAAGVQRITAAVAGLELQAKTVRLTSVQGMMEAQRVVICAGAWSRSLAAQAGDKVPLNTERGYHLEWDSLPAGLVRQMTPVARGFYFCPMADRLRVAGTVELGGLAAPASPHRWDALAQAARAILPDLPAPDLRWMGCRPSLPDSRPVISVSKAGPQILHAFGHGHLGLTLAPMTARLIADMVAGRAPELDLTPYRADRF